MSWYQFSSPLLYLKYGCRNLFIENEPTIKLPLQLSMEDDARDPKILERQPGAVERRDFILRTPAYIPAH